MVATVTPSPAPAPLSRPGRRWGRRLLWLVAGAVMVGIGLNLWVLGEARGRVFPVDGPVPPMPVALILGTSKRRENGHPNLHFQRRMDAAADLFKAGAVKVLLVSGDGIGPYYDEPRDMRDALVARGVPDRVIRVDKGGLRTLDSVMRVQSHFGFTRCLIVSDGWHVPRALFVARRIGLDAVGVSAREIDLRDSFNARSREWLARILVVLDVYLLHTRPSQAPVGS